MLTTSHPPIIWACNYRELVSSRAPPIPTDRVAVNKVEATEKAIKIRTQTYGTICK